MERTPWATIPQLIDAAATRFGDDEAFSDGEVTLTFAGLVSTIGVAARALMASGIEPGDRVAVWAPNILEWVQAALAVHSAGAVLVPINTRFKGAEAAYVLNRSKARLAFVVSDFLDTDYTAMLQGRDDLESLEQIVVLRGDAHDDAVPLADFLSRADEIPTEAFEARRAAVRGDDLCHILFTSGTTGAPKGVMLEHEAVCQVFDNLADVYDMRHGDRQLVVLPFFHSFGLHVGILCAFMRGITILPQSVFDPEAVMRRIQDDRVSLFPGPPTVFQAMIHSPRRGEFDLSSLRCVTIGAAGFPPTLITEISEQLGVPEIRTGFGLTETSGVVALVAAGEPPEVAANTVGRPVAGHRGQDRRQRRRGCPAGERGEVLVRGYTVMRGYLDDPEATANAIDGDGWLHTGDIGLLRADGNLSDHRPTSRTCSPSVGSTPTRPRSRRCWRGIPAWVVSRSSACPTSGSAKWAWPSSSRPGTTGRRRHRRVGTRRDGQLQGPAPRAARRRSAAERNRQGPQDRAQDDGRGAPGRVFQRPEVVPGTWEHP